MEEVSSISSLDDDNTSMHSGGVETADMTSKKKKRTQNQVAVHPVQQVQPQPQVREDSPIEVDIEHEKEAATTVEDVAVPVPVVLASLVDTTDSSSLISTASVPALTDVTLTPPRMSPSTHSLPTMSLESSRKSTPARATATASPVQSPQYVRGVIAKPQPVPSANVVTSMVELVHEVMPLSHQVTPSTQPERVEWVDIQRVAKIGDRSKTMDVLIMGLARGFQIWTITESGCCEEVVSERQGPIRVGRILPTDPESDESKDKFAESRPLFALVDSSFTQPEKQYCTAMFLTLSTGKVVHRLTFDDSILTIQASTSWVIIHAGRRIVVCDAFTLQERKSVEVAVTPDIIAPVSLACSFLAFADTKLRSEHLSCGGMSDPIESASTSYTGQMMQVAKMVSRTVTAVGGTTRKDDCKGVVSVVNLDNWSKSEEEFYLLHFIAHIESLSHLSLSSCSRLLVSADSSACEFNVFYLMPHSASSTLAAAQHLYVLSRGNTPAKVLSANFSDDCRWLGLVSNHGTVHLFATCPYGGVPTARTHGSRLLNQQSKFARSAGLAEGEAQLDARTRRQSGAPVNREHPSLKCSSLARGSGNPRVGPFPPPIVLRATKKIRERRFSSENLSAWAADLAHTSLSSGKKGKPEAPKMALAFAARPVNDSKGTSVLVLRADGVLCEYALRSSMGQAYDDPIKIDVVPEASWTLLRTKNSLDLCTPLQRGSPLMRWISVGVNEGGGGGGSGGRQRTDSTRVDPGKEWIGQVEDTCTYSAPHRRLWQGPQFGFYACSDEAIQVSASTEGTKSIPIVIGEGYGSLATRVEWSGSANSERVGDKERDEIAKKIADAMADLNAGGEASGSGKKEKGSQDELFFDSPEKNDDLLGFDDL